VTLALDTVNALYEPLLPAAILANAIIVLVISVVILVLDWRKTPRDLNHSFGLLGLGVAVLLLVGIVTTPLILSLIPGSTSSILQSAGSTAQSDGSLQSVLTAQTGLSIDDIQSQMDSGTSLAALVEANGGSVEAVTNALAQAINQAIDTGTVPQQMLERMGGDGTVVAAQIVNGDLPAQMASRVLGTFMGQSALPGPSGFPGGAQPDGAALNMSDNAAAVSDANTAENTAQAESRQARPENQSTADSEATSNQNTNAASESASPTPAPTITSTLTEIVPAAAVVTEEPTEIPATPTPTPEPATCPLVVNYNLNLRAQPDTKAELITTIPFGSVVQTTGQHEAGWWKVSYGSRTGWVSGEYVTPGTGCDALPPLS
jgi:hypothetical protein